MGASPEIRSDGFVIEATLSGRLREFVGRCTRDLSLQLQDCEAITFAANYRGFVHQFDTGFGPHERPEVSDRGVGFTPETLRDGSLGSHVIFPRMTLQAFDGKISGLSINEARNVIAHELAHADEHRRTALAFRDEILGLHGPSPDGLHVGRKAIWNEYYVCRTVASVNPGTLTLLEQSVRETMSDFGNACSTAWSRVAAGDDRERVKDNLISAGIRFLQTAAQLLGHVDGLGLGPLQTCQALQLHLANEQMEETFFQLHTVLKALWNAYPTWSGLEELQPIMVVLHERLKKA